MIGFIDYVYIKCECRFWRSNEDLRQLFLELALRIHIDGDCWVTNSRVLWWPPKFEVCLLMVN